MKQVSKNTTPVWYHHMNSLKNTGEALVPSYAAAPEKELSLAFTPENRLVKADFHNPPSIYFSVVPLFSVLMMYRQYHICLYL